MQADLVQESGSWIPLLEYAVRKNLSLSTLRRYIKSDKVRYRLEKGKYFLLDESPQIGRELNDPAQLDFQIKALQYEEELQKARQEIAELKTLIAFYEDHHSVRADS